MLNSRLPAAALILACTACAGDVPGSDVACSDPRILATLPAIISEASGVTISQRDSSLLWIHNDSEGSPVFYAVGTDGRLRAQIDVPDAPPQSDWEDIAAGPCPAGDCLYIGDIGDNLHARTDRAILRITVPDPDAENQTVVERFPFLYPGGPEDAEAIFVLPDTTVFVISKGRQGPVTVYRYPPPFRADETVTLEEVQQLTDGLAQLPDLVTGASARPDGRVVAVRTYSRVRFYSFADGRLVPLAPPSGFDLTPLREPQGEGVALSANGTVFTVSESGLESRAAPLAAMNCYITVP